MARRRMVLLSAITPLCALALSACGGSGTGLGTTPAPTPTPAPSYDTTAQLIASGTPFVLGSAGVQTTVTALSAPQAASVDSYPFGSGPTFEYVPALDAYRLTTATNAAAIFPLQTASTVDSDTIAYATSGGNGSDRLEVSVPKADGVTLSYTLLLDWTRVDGATDRTLTHWLASGVVTDRADLPTSGSASYDVAVLGTALSGGRSYVLDGNSTGTFTANFASGTVTTGLDLAGRVGGTGILTDFGAISGSGTISASRSSFGGTLDGASGSGSFEGAFFGPKGVEFGYGWFFEGATFEAIGGAAGAKK